MSPHLGQSLSSSMFYHVHHKRKQYIFGSYCWGQCDVRSSTGCHQAPIGSCFSLMLYGKICHSLTANFYFYSAPSLTRIRGCIYLYQPVLTLLLLGQQYLEAQPLALPLLWLYRPRTELSATKPWDGMPLSCVCSLLLQLWTMKASTLHIEGKWGGVALISLYDKNSLLSRKTNLDDLELPPWLSALFYSRTFLCAFSFIHHIKSIWDLLSSFHLDRGCCID